MNLPQPGPAARPRIPSTATNIDDALAQLRETSAFRSERERCISIHNFVRDEIAFGFTAGFERVSPEQTLAARRGHCNAQADLFCALLRGAGISARLRFTQIDKRILFGAVPLPIYLCLPATLFHAVTQVEIEGCRLNTDSYIMQPAIFFRQTGRLARSALPVGFGLTREACCEWDASSDSFTQACRNDLDENNPVFDSLAEAMAANAGNNKLLGFHFNQWLACIPPALRKLGERYLNSKLAIPA